MFGSYLHKTYMHSALISRTFYELSDFFLFVVVAVRDLDLWTASHCYFYLERSEWETFSSDKLLHSGLCVNGLNEYVYIDRGYLFVKKEATDIGGRGIYIYIFKTQTEWYPM